MVLRAQVFAGDALSHVAFTGVLAAALAGVDLRLGLFGATIAFALLFAALGDRLHLDDVAIGVVFSWVLGLGVLFLYLFSRSSSGVNGVIAARTLFGSIFSLTSSQALVALAIGAGVTVASRRDRAAAALRDDRAADRGRARRAGRAARGRVLRAARHRRRARRRRRSGRCSCSG